MKNKDPAFLFYTSDFLTGVTLMNYEQRGKYITLLCLQHQNGHLSEEDMLAICGKPDKKIFAKFVKDEEGLYYNERVDVEKEKRRKYTESQTKKVNKRWSQRRQNNTTVDTTVIPFENENEIDNKIILSSEVNKDNNITPISNTNTFSFSNTTTTNTRTREDPNRLKSMTLNIGGPANKGGSSAVLFISDAQVRSLNQLLTEEEKRYYLEKMDELIINGYKFGCSHYEFILRMVEEDRKTRKE
jgi:hypothetical protein